MTKKVERQDTESGADACSGMCADGTVHDNTGR